MVAFRFQKCAFYEGKSMSESKKRALSFSFCYKITLAKKGTQIKC